MTAYWPVLAYIALVCLSTATLTGSLNPANRTRKAGTHDRPDHHSAR